MKKSFFVFLSIFLISGALPVFAYVMSSPNYKIQFDSLNVGGRDIQSSNNYRLKETIGEIGTGIMASSLYKLKAGYRQMDEAYISISVFPQSVTMLPAISGVAGGQGNGSTTITVLTDNLAGYTLQVKSQTSPALKSNSYYFSDYTPQTQYPDFEWQVPPTTSEFGFTPEGEDIVQKFKDNGSVCNTGSFDTLLSCWYFFSTQDQTISQSFLPNHPSGTQTILRFRAESGSQNLQPSGIYEAQIVITAFTN